MFNSLFRKFKRRGSRGYQTIDPEDIFLDSTNLPGFAEHRFEGRIEKPIDAQTFMLLKGALFLILILGGIRLWDLQIAHGDKFEKISENNRLSHTLVFANRGNIYDRNGLELATNKIKSDDSEYAGRSYASFEGLAHVVGYLKYPSKDTSGFYYEENYRGQAGVEKTYNDLLTGKNGLKITETDALGNMISESVIEKPEDGNDLTLSLDALLTQELYKAMEDIAKSRGFTGGAGVIMDVKTGEVLALSNYPTYDQNIITEGRDKDAIRKLFNSKDQPFLDRATSGLYTPGSIVKPIMGLAVLNEKIITPDKKILSTGAITIPNPYDPTKPSIFRDWKVHGWVNLMDALAVSSDEYFYAVGGGYKDQKGIGINAIDRYFKMFGMAEKTGIDLPGEGSGVVANPEWKAKQFNNEPWRLGDTYITSIGQYGTQVTVLEAARWTAAIANRGKLIVPSVIKGGRPENERVFRTITLPENVWEPVLEGMRQGVTSGTITALNHPAVAFAAKTGTAELGVSKKLVNSWSTGFWPYENPRYAFAVLMERGDRDNTVGATYVMQKVENWMIINAREYIQ